MSGDGERLGCGLMLVVPRTGPRTNALEKAEELRTELARYDVRLELRTVYAARDMVTAITQYYSDVEKLGKCGSIWLVLSAHGRDNVISGMEDERPLGELVSALTDACQINASTKDKPVYVIVQACRGKNYPQGVYVSVPVPVSSEGELVEGLAGTVLDEPEIDAGDDDDDDELLFPGAVPICANQCLLYATTPGNVSFRSFLFDAMAASLQSGVHCDVETFFIHVMGRVAEDYVSKKKRKVTPQYYSQLLTDVTLKLPPSAI